ncbi:DUF177 domain-containing protein [Dyadobacter sandarakinus]|uniref:DUF177 domain-containing protein n=2 Tax=Dyadobacter sandarakinus TaxID=2747268 RepID=A0ABX7IE91_9BACT|nr:DUF177 domain-containing protein [Dyadobacter sandarakinus]
MESGDAFFEELEQDLVEHGRFKTHVVLIKSATMIQLRFHIEGELTLTCDRSLEPFDEHFDINERIILKYGDHNEELTDEIEIINRNTARVNVANYIFDFIALSLPVKKIHPDLRTDEDESDEEGEDGILVYSSESTDDVPESEDDAPVDPRWEALKKIKGNDN